VSRDLYNQNRCSYLLRRLENLGRKERVDVEDFTIEHIMPQNPNLTTEWQSDLGSDWKRIQETKLHTLGNLTLTGYNSEYSDRSFQQKRDMEGGFAKSPLQLNKGLGDIQAWNESEIDKRGGRLAEIAVQTWRFQPLPASTVDSYRSLTTGPRTTYTIQDHPNLVLIEPIRNLFEAFRKEVPALDPCVTEEFLKQYVSYKAETNFVDVIPQTERLVLILNMSFPELRDPRRIARDITHVGRWGNGDVEVPLTANSELVYAMGLIRQSFEKQMSNGDTNEL
jgi:predicted transport protein